MAVSLKRSCLPDKILESIVNDLTLIAKQQKGNHKARVTQIQAVILDATDVVVPMVYARNKFSLAGMKEPQKLDLQRLIPSYRNGQQEVFDLAMRHLRESNSVFLQLHCGWGKTWMALNLIAAMQHRTLICVHRRFLANQFITESKNVMLEEIIFLDDNDVSMTANGKVFVCTDVRLTKLPMEFLKTIDLIVVDEAKYWCTPQRVAGLLRCRPKYTIGLCAERDRKDGFDRLLDMFFGPNVFRKSTKPFTVWRYHTNWIPTIEYQKFGRGLNWHVAMKSLAEMEERNAFICDLCLMRPTNKIMILCQYKEHIKELKRLLEARQIDVGTFYDNNDSFRACRVLLASFSKASIGFDDSNLCDNFDGQRLDLLILAAFYKEEIEQSVGRVLRHDRPEVIDITDNYSSLKKHSKTRDKWYSSHSGILMPVEYIF